MSLTLHFSWLLNNAFAINQTSMFFMFSGKTLEELRNMKKYIWVFMYTDMLMFCVYMISIHTREL